MFDMEMFIFPKFFNVLGRSLEAYNNYIPLSWYMLDIVTEKGEKKNSQSNLAVLPMVIEAFRIVYYYLLHLFIMDGLLSRGPYRNQFCYLYQPMPLLKFETLKS